MSAELFDERSLRTAIVGVWGEHGAHVDVFDHIVKLTKAESARADLLREIAKEQQKPGPERVVGRIGHLLDSHRDLWEPENKEENDG